MSFPSHLFRRRLVVAAVAAPLLAVLAACGSSSTGSTTATSAAGSAAPASSSAASATSTSAGASASSMPSAFPVTVKGANGDVTLTAAPEHIVSLSPTATEMLFAIGAGPQVVAVDTNSNYPTDVPKTKLDSFKPNAEAVATYKPDLVVLSNDANGFVASLGKLKVPTLVLPAAATLDDAWTQLDTLGSATGHADDAKKVVQETKDRIAKAIASVPASAKGQKVYHELDQTFYSATSATFIGSIYKQMGLTNIADAKDSAAAGGYPQLSAEYVVTSAPDLIVLADTKCCQQDAASLAKRPGFSALPAVKNGKVLAADDDIASRWGPRIADFVEQVAKELGGGNQG